MAGSVPMSSLEHLGVPGPIWSLNERGARLFIDRLELRVETGDRASVCEVLSSRFGTVLARAGEQGSWFSDGSTARHIPSISVTPVDTNGAGDAYSGALAVALAWGVDLTTVLRWANAAGTSTVTHFGPVICPTEAETRTLA